MHRRDRASELVAARLVLCCSLFMRYGGLGHRDGKQGVCLAVLVYGDAYVAAAEVSVYIYT